MSRIARKGILAIAAVVEIAMSSHERPMSARTLASRHKLPPRHLEPLLQALVREGILKGVRGPRGGYELGRDRRHISADDIVRAASQSEDEAGLVSNEAPLGKAVQGALAEAERAFSAALARISVDDIVQRGATAR